MRKVLLGTILGMMTASVAGLTITYNEIPHTGVYSWWWAILLTGCVYLLMNAILADMRSE